MTIGTKETLQTLTFSRQGNVTEKTTRNRTDLSATVEERMLYRYDPAGKMTGEFVADSDVEWVPLRLYLYDHEGRLAAEAAYHLCRTFSALHLYQYDEANRLVEHLRFESRRLSRRELLYGQNGRLQTVRTYRNGQLFQSAHYHYNNLGQMITIEWTLPDGTVTSSIASTYFERGNVMTRIEQYPGDSARDQIEITSYEYDAKGNWTRRTVIRAVNPVDEEGQPFEDPVQITEREITYEPSSHFSAPYEPLHPLSYGTKPSRLAACQCIIVS